MGILIDGKWHTDWYDTKATPRAKAGQVGVLSVAFQEQDRIATNSRSIVAY